MAKYDYDLIVIGGGAAGLTSSTFAGQTAAKTLLIEREEKLGGDCLHYGCVPSKTLIKSAYAYNVMRQAAKYGLPDVELPKVDLSKVRDRIRGVVDKIQEHDEPEYLEDKYNVETQFGSPKFLDKHTIELSGKEITARYFVVATGSTPFVPLIEGINDVPYITNMQIFNLDELPESMIVLGGGPIGMEMAQSFARLGSKVTVVEFAPSILIREDEDIAAYMTEQMEAEGINLLAKTKAVKVKHENGTFTVTVDKEGKTSTIQAQSLLVATGRKPNVDGLDLEKANVEYTPRGIKVNNKLQTTQKNIYACGDVNGGLAFTHVASYEAVVAITNMILKVPTKANYTNTPWVTYLDPEVASIGYNETRACEAGIDYVLHKETLAHNDRALAEGETKGFIKILINKKSKPIGVQIVGYHAGDLIHEWVPVLNSKLKLSALTNSIHAYPTLSEINKNASVNYTVSTIPSWTKGVLKMVFGYQGKV
ncbi:MAG: dihydrolipoamide dehydrogenase [Lysobacterales bacterium]|jgi:dihydrolipoamide dehydrogenase